MKIYRTKWFAIWAKQQGISDDDLCDAVDRANRGSIDANLGGSVIKQRIARPNQGKSGGFRTIIYFRIGEHSFFVFGFAKSDRENLSKPELKVYKALAKEFLLYTDEQIEILVNEEKLTEVNCVPEQIQE